MGKTTGFMEYKRVDESYDAVDKRLKHYKEFTIPVKEKELQNQGARCMDCGIPFCHSGCPLGNVIPQFNDAVYRNEWKDLQNFFIPNMKMIKKASVIILLIIYFSNVEAGKYMSINSVNMIRN